MIPNYTPPPPQPAPAEVQTINAEQAQRLASPEQSIINNVNQKGFAVRVPNSQAQAGDLNKSIEGIAKGVGELGTARSKGDAARARSNALRGPSFTDRPTNKPSANKGNKGIESMKAKAANGHQPASRNALKASPNKGIEAARQKSSPKQAGTGTAQAKSSSNKGIASYQSKMSGQSAPAAKGSSGASAAAAKGSGASAGKSSGSSSGGKSSGGGGQSR